MIITGHTRVFGILADPIGHIRTPQAFNPFVAERGIDAVMVPLHVAPDDLAQVVAGLRAVKSFGGAIVTVPHKTTIPALCDALEGDAARIGAVNAIRREPDGRLIGAMFDGDGFIAGLRAQGIEPQGMRALVAGAGGAGAAIAFALAGAGVAHLTVTNRTEARARALCDRIAESYPDLALATGVLDAGGADVGACDLVVNATTLGMRPGDVLPVEAAALHPGQIVAEAINAPTLTPLLAQARALGCRIHEGHHMLAAQIELMARHMGALP